MPLLTYNPALPTATARNKVDTNDWEHVRVPLEAVRTLLNTTLLDYLNVQAHGLTSANLRDGVQLSAGHIRVHVQAASQALALGDLVFLNAINDPHLDGTNVYAATKAATAAVGSLWTPALACAIEAIAPDAYGTVALTYEARSLDTSAGARGDPVWLSGATAGAWSLAIPDGPKRCQLVGRITYSHATAGRILFSLPGTTVPWSLADQV
jgi:hypothetical protein